MGERNERQRLIAELSAYEAMRRGGVPPQHARQTARCLSDFSRTAEHRKAVETCQRMASELARLSEEKRLADEQLAGLRSGANINRAFVEIARIVLAEPTFQRIMGRAEERAAAYREGRWVVSG